MAPSTGTGMRWSTKGLVPVTEIIDQQPLPIATTDLPISGPDGYSSGVAPVELLEGLCFATKEHVTPLADTPTRRPLNLGLHSTRH